MSDRVSPYATRFVLGVVGAMSLASFGGCDAKDEAPKAAAEGIEDPAPEPVKVPAPTNEAMGPISDPEKAFPKTGRADVSAGADAPLPEHPVRVDLEPYCSQNELDASSPWMRDAAAQTAYATLLKFFADTPFADYAGAAPDNATETVVVIFEPSFQGWRQVQEALPKLRSLRVALRPACRAKAARESLATEAERFVASLGYRRQHIVSHAVDLASGNLRVWLTPGSNDVKGAFEQHFGTVVAVGEREPPLAN